MKQTLLETLVKSKHHAGSYQYVSVEAAKQPAIAAQIKSHQGVLITEWIAPDEQSNETYWYVLYYCQLRWICVQSPLKQRRPAITDLSNVFPIANRLQRAIYDLTKIPTQQAKDKRPWLSHGHFISGTLNPHVKSHRYAKTSYPFIKVTGDGVHEIPVGPVHAGIIEPGHFHFSVVGERILKLEERLGYAHKGIHHLLLGKTIQEGAKLLGRVSGDTTVAYAYAFALACENQLGIEMDTDTQLMRAVLLERERLANHIGDIGAIINDTGFTSLATQFSILKETLLRENAVLTNHRYMMDTIVPSEAIAQWDKTVIETSSNQLAALAQQISELQDICHHHHGLQDRLKTTGTVSQDTAQSLGLLGVTAKASGIIMDIRAVNTHYPYTGINFTPIVEKTGDVAARVNVRFRECLQSIEILRQFLTMACQSSPQKPDTALKQPGIGLGCAEGWRGAVCIAVQLDKNKRITWCHFHDPSWQNWLALEHAVIGNIVADFPLINKSFNLSYSGQDS